ncbi:unnamed protein product [Vicia faba]|uniref:Uncharacterized protein n=1 Tax=Vicia faba TaxID=3906 RepID=A0AAV1ALA3_VICFA|nr:unnamed protein product [Vicia faba]
MTRDSYGMDVELINFLNHYKMPIDTHNHTTRHEAFCQTPRVHLLPLKHKNTTEIKKPKLNISVRIFILYNHGGFGGGRKIPGNGVVGAATGERDTSTIVTFEMCRKPTTNLSFLRDGGSGGGHKRRKGNLTVGSGGEREIPLRSLVMVRT